MQLRSQPQLADFERLRYRLDDRRRPATPEAAGRAGHSGCGLASGTRRWRGVGGVLGWRARGPVTLLFLDISYDEAKRSGRLGSEAALDEALVHGAVKRARPKVMTVAAAFMGLVPIMWSTSAGSDVMKRIAAPMIGGLATSFLMELLAYPAIYKLWKRREACAAE